MENLNALLINVKQNFGICFKNRISAAFYLIVNAGVCYTVRPADGGSPELWAYELHRGALFVWMRE